MEANENLLTVFSTRVRQLILLLQEIKAENRNLKEQLDAAIRHNQELETQIAKQNADYQSLKTAKMLEISDGDITNAQKRVSKLIRDVNKCITLLSE